MPLAVEQINQWRNCRQPQVEYTGNPIERFIKMNGIISLDSHMEATHLVIIRDPKRFPKKGKKICLNIDPEGQSVRQCDNCDTNLQKTKATRALFTAHLSNFVVLGVLFGVMLFALVLLFRQQTIRFRWPSLYMPKHTTSKPKRLLRIFES